MVTKYPQIQIGCVRNQTQVELINTLRYLTHEQRRELRDTSRYTHETAQAILIICKTHGFVRSIADMVHCLPLALRSSRYSYLISNIPVYVRMIYIADEAYSIKFYCLVAIIIMILFKITML